MLATTYEITRVSIMSIALSRCMNQCNISPAIAKLRDICTIHPVNDDIKHDPNTLYVSGKEFPLDISTYAEILESGKTANYTITMHNHNELQFLYITYYLKVASQYITTSDMLAVLAIPIFPSKEVDNMQYMIKHML